MKYLLRHRENYYYKRKIPQTRTSFTISLRTDSYKEAKFILNIIDPKFQNLGVQIMNWEEEKAYIKEIIQSYINEAREDYEKFAKIRAERYTFKTKNHRKVLGSHPKAIEKAVKNLGYAIHSPKEDKEKAIEDLTIYSTIKNQYNEALETLSENGQENLQDEIIKAEIELLFLDKRNNTERLENPNEYIEIQNKTVEQLRSETTPSEAIRNKNYKEKNIQEVINLFLEKKAQENVNPDTIRRYAGDFKIFKDLIDKEYLIDISHEDLDKFIQDIKLIPNFNTNRKVYKEFSDYKEIIKATKERNLETIKPQTIELKLVNVSALLDLATSYELIDTNRIANKFSKNKKNHETIPRVEYNAEQLEALFYNSIWYKEDLEKNLKEAPHKVWLPLLMLFSGYRLNEAAQIYLDQIETIDHNYFINVTDEKPDQQLKNLSSKRKTPIHSLLLEMGFAKYIEEQKKKGEVRLFSKLYYTKNKGYGQAFSKMYTDFKSNFLDEKTTEELKAKVYKLDIHSFRHNFAGSLKGKIEDGLLDYLMGHTNSSTTQNRYGSYRAEVLINAVNSVDYPQVDFMPLVEKLKRFYSQK